jgi:hypothetical protein
MDAFQGPPLFLYHAVWLIGGMVALTAAFVLSCFYPVLPLTLLLAAIWILALVGTVLILLKSARLQRRLTRVVYRAIGDTRDGEYAKLAVRTSIPLKVYISAVRSY